MLYDILIEKVPPQNMRRATTPVISENAPPKYAKTTVFISFPILCQTIECEVIFSETIGDLLKRAVTPICVPDSGMIFQLFAIGKDCQLLDEKETCSTLFLKPYEELRADVATYTITTTVYYEGRKTNITHNASSPIGDIMELVSLCFNIELGNTSYVAINPSDMTVCRMKDPVKCPILLVKRVDLFRPGIVFDAHSVADLKTVMIATLSKILLCAPMKQLFSSIRMNKWRENYFQLDDISPARTREILDLFLKGDAAEKLSLGEQTSLMFILIASGNKPLIPEKMRAMVPCIMNEENDVERIALWNAFAAFLPIETSIILIELGQTYGGIMATEEDRQAAVELLTEIFFGPELNREMEQKFIAFGLMYYQWIFGFPKGNRSLKVWKGRLVLFDNVPDKGDCTMTYEGPVEIDTSETEDYVLDRKIDQVLHRMCELTSGTGAVSPVIKAFGDMNAQLMEKRKRLAKILDEAREQMIFGDFTGNDLFAEPI